MSWRIKCGMSQPNYTSHQRSIAPVFAVGDRVTVTRQQTGTISEVYDDGTYGIDVDGSEFNPQLFYASEVSPLVASGVVGLAEQRTAAALTLDDDEARP